ncbi:hypothetical protein A3F19_00960 [Candidatus Nomurabacteria bacterium RIFCSPHIGHO2_12_FULL_37_29]|uniref:Uncharacterized protein n=1 Tax=Candidatus Nomurabacteria bacterium RIFCSPHIGHO2_12_FULL_37_29 TaxID=1801759 RepID=A0A1F6WBR2_9BACT|nr:MAG: hypothetical protein A3F19_00960 [Candidatus Nomurabacteria bacterium RIFCSPHIGHO2_12_FULL_37_29]
MLTKKVVRFFDKLEDKIRAKLSHTPIFYGFLGGIGVVLFWRGVWHIADDINLSSIVSIITGSIILLLTGVFVSAFVGNRLIISGLIGEKKLAERAEEEIESEEAQIKNLQNTLGRMEKKLDHIDKEIEGK